MPRKLASRQERGYGAAHKAERRKWEPHVASGDATCYRCDEPIDPKGPWDLGHNEDRTGWTGPEHVKCNRSAGGRNAAAVTHDKNRLRTWDW